MNSDLPDKLFCPVCSSPLRLFRMMYLRQMYWYVECTANCSHYRWPEKWGFDSPEDLKQNAIKRGITCITAKQEPKHIPMGFVPL